jgi:hypothetical protein
MPLAIALSQYRVSRLNNPPRGDHRTAAQDEMWYCHCGVTIKKSSYRTHRYRSDEHVDYMIFLCMLRDAQIDAQVEQSLRLQQAETKNSARLRKAKRVAVRI